MSISRVYSLSWVMRPAPGDVLPDAHDADDLAVGVATRRGVEKDLDARALLGHQGELIVRRLVAAQGPVDDHPDGGLVVLGDEFLDEVLF